MDCAVGVAQCGDAEGEVLDRAGETGDADAVAYVVLVFEEDEDPVEDVLEEGLGTEADANAEDSGGGEQRGDGNPEDGEDVEQDDESDDAVSGGAQDGGDGAEFGGSLGIVVWRSASSLMRLTKKATMRASTNAMKRMRSKRGRSPWTKASRSRCQWRRTSLKVASSWARLVMSCGASVKRNMMGAVSIILCGPCYWALRQVSLGSMDCDAAKEAEL